MTVQPKVIPNRLGLEELDRQLKQLAAAGTHKGKTQASSSLNGINQALSSAPNGKAPLLKGITQTIADAVSQGGVREYSPIKETTGKKASLPSVFVCLQLDWPPNQELLNAIELLSGRHGVHSSSALVPAAQNSQLHTCDQSTTRRPFDQPCAQDTFYVNRLNDLGRIYQQTFVDPSRRLVFAKLYQRKSDLEAADLLNSRVIPFFEENGLPLSQVLTDRGREFCGAAPKHRYEFYLSLENIAHQVSQSQNPQHNALCSAFHKTLLDEFYNSAFRRKQYSSLEALQADLDQWIEQYNASSIASLPRAV
jgi:hypothetical protein